MKKIFLILLAGALLTIASCTKDTTTGPAGTNGLNGATGPTGPTGSAGGGSGTTTVTAALLDFQIQPTSWINAGTSGSPGAFTYATGTDYRLDYSYVGSGVVLAYWDASTVAGTQTWIPMPAVDYFTNSSGYTFTVTYNWYDGGISFNSFNTGNLYTTYSGVQEIKVIVIPGTSKTAWSVDLKNYNAVKAYFKL